MRNITGQSMALKILAVLLAVGFLAGFLLFLFRGEQEDNTQEAANSKAGTEDADAKKPTDEGKEQDKDKKNGEKKDDPKAKDKDAKKDKKKKDPPPVPDFDTPKLSVLPFDTSAQSRVFEQGIKPGHWTAAIVEMKANNFDFAGELDCTLFNNDGRPIQLPGLPYQMVSRRPVVLPKGQKKFFEAVFYPAPPNDGKGPKLHARLLVRFERLLARPRHRAGISHQMHESQVDPFQMREQRAAQRMLRRIHHD